LNKKGNFFSLTIVQFSKFFALRQSAEKARDEGRMEDSHKPHRAPHSGNKADKKKAKKNGVPQKKGNNPKAFTMSGSRRAEKIARRSTEVLFDITDGIFAKCCV
jgi:hypothetical protein